jgi:hypothetical protein
LNPYIDNLAREFLIALEDNDLFVRVRPLAAPDSFAQAFAKNFHFGQSIVAARRADSFTTPSKS